MKKIVFVILLFIAQNSFGQANGFNHSNPSFNYYNSVNLEILGHGGYYSLNYERIIANTVSIKNGYQAGISYFQLPTSTKVSLRIPFGYNYLFSFYQHHIELGLGQVIKLDYVNNTLDDFDLVTSFKLGYRYQHPDGRLILKAMFTPTYYILGYYSGGTFSFLPGLELWGGVSLGYAF